MFHFNSSHTCLDILWMLSLMSCFISTVFDEKIQNLTRFALELEGCTAGCSSVCYPTSRVMTQRSSFDLLSCFTGSYHFYTWATGIRFRPSNFTTRTQKEKMSLSLCVTDCDWLRRLETINWNISKREKKMKKVKSVRKAWQRNSERGQTEEMRRFRRKKKTMQMQDWLSLHHWGKAGISDHIQQTSKISDSWESLVNKHLIPNHVWRSGLHNLTPFPSSS